MSKKTPYYKENIDAVIGASGEKEAFETDIRRSWCYQKVIKSIGAKSLDIPKELWYCVVLKKGE